MGNTGEGILASSFSLSRRRLTSTSSSVAHTLVSNMKFEPGEFNLMKELRDKGPQGRVCREIRPLQRNAVVEVIRVQGFSEIGSFAFIDRLAPLRKSFWPFLPILGEDHVSSHL